MSSVKLCLLGALLALFLAFSSCASVPSLRVADSDLQRAASISEYRPSWRELWPGIAVNAALISMPRLSLRAVRVDLQHPDIDVLVGPAVFPAKGVFTSSFARQSGCVVAINANPFVEVSALEGRLNTTVGIAISEGRVIAPPESRLAALLFPYEGIPRVVQQKDLPALSVGQTQDEFRYAVGGFFVVLEEGLATGHPSRRYPRSAAAVSQDGRYLYLLTIDGRKPGLDMATEIETGELLAQLGAWNGLILDGGGSSTLVLRQEDGSITAFNTPMHRIIPGQERAVTVCLGIGVRGD